MLQDAPKLSANPLGELIRLHKPFPCVFRYEIRSLRLTPAEKEYLIDFLLSLNGASEAMASKQPLGMEMKYISECSDERRFIRQKMMHTPYCELIKPFALQQFLSAADAANIGVTIGLGSAP